MAPVSPVARPIAAPATHVAAQPRAFGSGALRRVAGLIGLNQSNSLARRFLLASLLVLLAGGVTVGWWVGGQLERGIVDRTASITGLYVQSFIEPHLEGLSANEWLDDSDIADLDELLTQTAFGDKVVALKVWRPDGVIVYSPDRALIGQSFPVEDGLAQALSGEVVAAMSALDADENVSEQARGFDRLLEMYLPVREHGGAGIIAVAEFYQLPTDIDRQVADAQLTSWLVVGGAVALVYLLLFGIVRQGSETIDRQQLALQSQVNELSALLAQNEQLRDRVRTAAERTTTLSERNLRRISADLHDGPGQMLALAMLRLDQLHAADGGPVDPEEIARLQSALQDALRDMRGIAAGLRLPELSGLTTAEVVRRAADDHARRTGTDLTVDIAGLPTEATLPVKIALFRATQELLSNATRHGEGRGVTLDLSADNDWLQLRVEDAGPGFDDIQIGEGGHLGLAGVREQAELLGGSILVASRPGGGAGVTVRWPLAAGRA
jgi:signal transduction histidine kinase